MSIENQIETILNNVPQVYVAGQNSAVDEFREELDGVKDDVETLDNNIAELKQLNASINNNTLTLKY